MEMDMQSPSFRSYRPAKRPRSPDGADAADSRPIKRRLSIQLINEVLPFAQPRPSSYDSSPVGGPFRGGPEERWVAQTRSLSITSPHMQMGMGGFGGMNPGMGGGMGCPTPPPAQNDADESMNMDADAPIPQLFASQCIPSFTMLDAPASTSYPQQSQQHLPTIHVSRTPSPYPTPAPSPGPSAFVSTPGQPQSHSHPTFGSETHPGFASTMLLRPNHPATPTPPLHTAGYTCSPLQGPERKPRVTMGPRADCDKCRMGVKGHWMHFD